MALNLKEFQQTAYYGMNDTTSPLAMHKFEATSIENWLIRFQGKLRRRMGLTEVGTDAGTTGVNNITHWQSGSTNISLKVIGKTIKSLSGTTWSNHGAAPTFATAGDVNFCFANGFQYAFNGTDSPKKLGQTTSADVAAIPAGAWAVWYRNYMFVGGVAAYPNRIYFSNLGDPETYTAADYIDIEPGDGDSLTGAITSGPDKLFITKNRSVHYLTGAGTNSFAVYPLVRDFGIASFRSLINVGGDIWGVTPSGRIMSLLKNQYGLYSGQDMSEDFLNETTRGLNQQALNGACSAFIDGYVLIAVPNGAATTNSLILVYDTVAPIPSGKSRWVSFTGWDITCFDVNTKDTDEELFMGDADTDQVFKWAGNNDDGTVITATWIGAEQKFESVGSLKRFRQIKIAGFPLGDYNLQVYTSVDNGTFTNIGALNLSSSGGTWGTSVWGAFLWGAVGIVLDRLHFSDNAGKVMGYKAQLKFIYNANSDEPTISTHSIYFSPRRWR
jgi:hypothetical protein